jgi:methylmalonyl-CoA mutase, N-terminal domain
VSDVRDTTTDAGIPVREVYTEDDLAPGLAERLGAPGVPPFTRGPYSTMYRGRMWTMRQFAGFGSPEEARADGIIRRVRSADPARL